MSKWIIRGCLAVTSSACLIVMALGDGGAFLAATVLLVGSMFVFVAMLEAVD